ncbi:MAG: molybdenum cofactor biosynthesis protein MoaE [Calditrichaeota bacterium]|nr:MAG: molybdenum cofactor biosynthesis protein MoaE [Calditrichota bacterium]
MVEITDKKIDVDALLKNTENPATGGVAIFIGRVRNHAHGKIVEKMEYFGYEKMAIFELEKIEAEARQKWPVREMAIVHRLGMQHIGDASVVIAVSCDHRADAFDACRFVIDTLKKTVPIWKKEYGPNGEEWVDGEIPQPE